MSPGRVGICVRLGFFSNADVVNHSWSDSFSLSRFPPLGMGRWNVSVLQNLVCWKFSWSHEIVSVFDCQSVCQEVLTKPPRLQSENLKEMRYHYNISALLIRESLTSENHACITTKSLQWKLLFLRCYAWRTKSFIIIERIIYMLLLESYRKAWV